MTRDSSPHSRAGQREKPPRREQLLSSVHRKAVKQLHIPDDQQVLGQNLIMAREMVCELQKKSPQILLRSQNWNLLSKDLD